MKTFKIILLCVALSACETSVIQLADPVLKDATPITTNTVRHYWWGASGDDNTDLRNMCPGRGINSIESKNVTWNGFMNFITAGIYIPNTYSFYCNKK